MQIENVQLALLVLFCLIYLFTLKKRDHAAEIFRKKKYVINMCFK